MTPVKNFTNVSVFAKVPLTSLATRQKPLQKAQNAIKFRSKTDKTDQKGPGFVLPILTFQRATPSGASAKAVFAFSDPQKGGAPL
ncbi:MAG: hypothetical protein NTY65_02520 [Planctomycetota bacterium]|nr:hypothetical protein [Planctomycetota bacterium]